MANKFSGYRRQISPSSVWLWQKLPIPGPEEMPVAASGTRLPSGTHLPDCRPQARCLRFSLFWNAVRSASPFASEIEDFVMAFGPVPVRSGGRCAIMHMCTRDRSAQGTP